MAVYPGRDIERQAALGAEAADGAARAHAGSAPEGARCREFPLAPVAAVVPGSPADDAGFTPGCYVTSVDGRPVRDLIDWRWLASDDEIELGYVDADGEEGVCELWREEGECWGLEFDGVVFDRVRQCRNACSFCFMRQLPDDARSSLTLRDDDFRLSFLCGTFVTFTNLRPEDERRIVEQAISPLRFSLHVADPAIRRTMIGRHAQHGIDALERLLSQGIQVHAQIVLVPGENDGEALRDTLEWAYERPGILDVCVVPLGYTKYQACFSRSFGEPAAALAVLEQLRPFQQRALGQRGTPWVFGADEFYLNAYGSRVLEGLPPASFYGDFEMFEDGVGIVRTCADDWERACERGDDLAFRQAAEASGAKVAFVAGTAMRPYFDALVQRSRAAGFLEPLYVENRYFGGNVNVTGLLCACDIVEAVNQGVAAPAPGERALVALPSVIFNDRGLTLDGLTLADMEKAVAVPGVRLVVVSCQPTEFFPDIIAATSCGPVAAS